MKESIYKESYKDLLGVMASISSEMNEVILLKYFDKLGINNKYLLSLFNESYKSVYVACEALGNGYTSCISQAAVVLRLFLESTSLIRVLTMYPDLLEKYIQHYKIRIKISHNPKKEQLILEEEFPDVDKNSRLSYMDYGWFESKLEPRIKNAKRYFPKETDLIKLAGFSDIIDWKKQYLDKLSHQSFMMENMIDSNGEFPIVVAFVKIMCKLFDNLCCDFHKLTGFDFVFDGKSMFQGEFRKIYKEENFE